MQQVSPSRVFLLLTTHECDSIRNSSGCEARGTSSFGESLLILWNTNEKDHYKLSEKIPVFSVWCSFSVIYYFQELNQRFSTRKKMTRTMALYIRKKHRITPVGIPNAPIAFSAVPIDYSMRTLGNNFTSAVDTQGTTDATYSLTGGSVVSGPHNTMNITTQGPVSATVATTYQTVTAVHVSNINSGDTQPTRGPSLSIEDVLSVIKKEQDYTSVEDSNRLVPSEKGEDSDQQQEFKPNCDDGNNKVALYNRSISKENKTSSEIKPSDLVEALSVCPKFSSSLQNLMETDNMGPLSIRKIAFKYPYVFCLKDEDVELKPEISICKSHCGPKGCQYRESCRDLHLCPEYILGNCHDSECVLGHKWNTGHNYGILENLFLDNLPPHLLLSLIKANKITNTLDDAIDVCLDYNGDGCDYDWCNSLHICLTFIAGLAKGNISACQQNCSLNHSFMTSNCFHLLESYGLPTNEAPRDIALALLAANPSIFGMKNSISLNTSEVSSPDVLCISSNDHNKKGFKRRRTESDTEVKTLAIYSPPRTVWSHYQNGDISIPEICYFSVEGMCDNEDSGCLRLHASQHFHWQVSKQGEKWINLRPEQVKCLERAYCDPSKDSVTLPRLDPATLEHSPRNLLNTMGREEWSSDFYTMTLTNSSNTKKLYIRRLVTEMTKGVRMKPATFVWYFLDNNDTWTQYGLADSLLGSNLTCNVSSEQIENLYLQGTYKEISFSNQQFNYILNFENMEQRNQGTGKIRQVMRRPVKHLQDEGMMDLPLFWKPMSPLQRVLRIAVQDTTPDFKAIFELVTQKQNFSFNWLWLERIQNPFLWRAYQNKVKEMTVVYGSSAAVDVRYLFHGTTPDIVKNICEENFDWRLHGLKNGCAYGRGTYFSTSASYSFNYTRPDASGYRYMFVATVAVGTKALGNSSLTRPPVNPSTKLPFDSTVDRLQDPSIIVKYDKQEYYPEYLLMFN